MVTKRNAPETILKPTRRQLLAGAAALGATALTPSFSRRAYADDRKVLKVMSWEQFQPGEKDGWNALFDKFNQSQNKYKVDNAERAMGLPSSVYKGAKSAFAEVEKKPASDANAKLSFYANGAPGKNWEDLCRGPHVPSTGRIGAAIVTSLASSYWHGDENSDRLIRVYGTAFPTEEQLQEHLKLLEEAKARDHRKLGKELELFMFHEYAPAMPFLGVACAYGTAPERAMRSRFFVLPRASSAVLPPVQRLMSYGIAPRSMPGMPSSCFSIHLMKRSWFGLPVGRWPKFAITRLSPVRRSAEANAASSVARGHDDGGAGRAEALAAGAESPVSSGGKGSM